MGNGGLGAEKRGKCIYSQITTLQTLLWSSFQTQAKLLNQKLGMPWFLLLLFATIFADLLLYWEITNTCCNFKSKKSTVLWKTFIQRHHKMLLKEGQMLIFPLSVDLFNAQDSLVSKQIISQRGTFCQCIPTPGKNNLFKIKCTYWGFLLKQVSVAISFSWESQIRNSSSASKAVFKAASRNQNQLTQCLNNFWIYWSYEFHKVSKVITPDQFTASWLKEPKASGSFKSHRNPEDVAMSHVTVLKFLLLPLCSQVILGTGPNAIATSSNKPQTA